MTIVLRLLLAVWSVPVAYLVAEVGSESRQYWDEIKVLHEKGDPGSENPNLEQYLKSLSPEQMITAARQACERQALYGIVLCFKHYVDKSDNVEQAMARLLEIVSDARQHRDLRRTLLQMLAATRFNQFVDELQTHVQKHRGEVEHILRNILEDQEDHVAVRAEASARLAGLLAEEVRNVTRADANVRAMGQRTQKKVPIRELLDSGELRFTEDTLEALESTKARTVAYVKLLGAILADEQHEPKELRMHAERRLKLYRESLLGIGDDVEKALGQAND